MMLSQTRCLFLGPEKRNEWTLPASWNPRSLSNDIEVFGGDAQVFWYDDSGEVEDRLSLAELASLLAGAPAAKPPPLTQDQLGKKIEQAYGNLKVYVSTIRANVSVRRHIRGIGPDRFIDRERSLSSGLRNEIEGLEDQLSEAKELAASYATRFGAPPLPGYGVKSEVKGAREHVYRVRAENVSTIPAVIDYWKS